MKKPEIVAELVKAEVAFTQEMDQPYSPTALLIEAVNEAISAYVDALRNAASRFPSFYAPFIWESAMDDCYDPVAHKIKQVASSKYWLEQMEPRSSRSPLSKLPPGSQEKPKTGRSSGKSSGTGCMLPAVFSILTVAWILFH